MNKDDYYTVTELANAIGYSRERIYQLIRGGKYTTKKIKTIHTKLGYLIPISEAKKWIRLNTNNPGANIFRSSAPASQA